MNNYIFRNTLLTSLHENLKELSSGLRKPYSVYSFFSSMGWNLSGLNSDEFNTISEKMEQVLNIISNFFKEGEITQSEIIQLGQGVKRTFEIFSRELIEISTADLSEEHIYEFTKDCSQYLFVLFLAENYPLLLRLGELFGVIKYRSQASIIIDIGGEEVVLRRQVEVYHIEVDKFLALPLSLIDKLITELEIGENINLNDFSNIFKEKLEDVVNEISVFYKDSLQVGIDITLDSKGLHIEGDVFGFSQLSDPLTLQLPPQKKITLALNGGKTELLWSGVMDDITQSFSVISEDGLSFQLGGNDVLTSNGEIHFHISEIKSYVELKGKIGFQLPPDIIKGVDGELISDGNFVFHYEVDGDYYLQLEKLRVEGSLQFGGSDGIKLVDSNLSIKDLVYPKPTSDMNLETHFLGKLSWNNNSSANSTIEVKGEYENKRLTLDSTGDLHLGNGIWLHPISDQQAILHANIETSSSGEFDFEVNALFKIPHEIERTIDVEVSGNLTLKNINGNLHLSQLTVSNKVSNLVWELPGGMKLNNASLDIIYKNNQFIAAINGKLDLYDDSSIEIDAILAFPDTNHPENIRIYTGTEVENINLFNQLYIYSGKLELNVTTQPLSGKLAIIEARADFLPKNGINVNPTSAEFYIGIESLTSHFSFFDSKVDLEITSGQLVLTESFTRGNQRPLVKIGNQPLLLSYSNKQLLFQFSIIMENIDVNFSDSTSSEFSAILEHTTLHLNSDKAIPWMTDTKGKIILPIDNQSPLKIDFDEVEWDILGFPLGSIYLDQDIIFHLGGDFELKIKGGINHGIKTGITISKNTTGLPTFILNGAVELVVPIDMILMEGGEQIIIGSSGNISWQANKSLVLSLEELSIGGSFTLGGRDGLKIQEGLLKATGINSILNPTKSSPFELLLSGKLYLGKEGPGAGIEDARFTFIGEKNPKFNFDGISVDLNDQLLKSVEKLPFKVTKLNIKFVDENIPLPQKIKPTNIRVTFSVELDFPMPSGANIIGIADNMSINFNEYGIPIKKNGDIGIDIGGIGLGIKDFEAGVISLTGTVYLSGLDKPEDLFFAGKLGGKINGIGVNALLALGLDGPKGLCLEMSGGAAGIPLGPTGFLLTGAEGGVIFPNLDGKVSNANPCDIRTYISLNNDGRPIRVNQNTDSNQEVPSDEKVIQETSTKLTTPIDKFTCPEGDCPSPAISIISQPHPDRIKYPDRIIVKFTSIDQSVLDDIGLRESFFTTFGGTDTPEEIANKTIQPLFDFFDSNLPDLNNLVIPNPPNIKTQIETAILELKEKIRHFLIETLTESIQTALLGNSSIYEAVKEIAYAGIPSPETTVKLTGSFSYVGVSTFLSITGGFSLSTVMIPTPVPLISTVGILGSINVLGIPMGTANLFLNMTDSKGDLLGIPSLCGDIHASIGPIEFGQMKMKFQADGLLDGFANAGAIFVTHLSEELIIQLINLVDDKIVKDINFDSKNPFKLIINNPKEASNKVVAIIGGLMNLPIDKEVRNCLIALMEDAWESFDPKFELCGQVQPKLFGFGLGGEIAGAMINIDKTSYKAHFSFSPSYMIGSLFGGILPSMDKASIGMAFELPNPIEMSKKILGTDNATPLDTVKYLEEGFEHVLENAIYTIEYELIPMGLKMADAEARLVMPDFLDHPAHPNSTWIRPENRLDKEYLSRLKLLTKALNNNLLANPLWKGTSEELETLSSSNSHQTYGLSMQDYFPHGGMLGAAKLSLPIALLDGVPPQLVADLFNDKNEAEEKISLISRFNTAKELLDDYILNTRDIGKLAFYIPFPNPLTIAINGKTPIQLVQDMVESGFAWSSIEIGDLFSKEVAFFEGYIDDAQILGIPVFNAHVTAYGANDIDGTAGNIEIIANIPENSWFQEFVDEASLIFSLTQKPAVSLDIYLNEAKKLVNQSLNQNSLQKQLAIEKIQTLFTESLPKLKMEAKLEGLKIPDDLSKFMNVKISTSLIAKAYSPFYNPNAIGTSIDSQLQRNGGIYFEYNCDFEVSNIFKVQDINIQLIAMPLSDRSILPKFLGQFSIDKMQIPFSDENLKNCNVQFNSNPNRNENIVFIKGTISSIPLGLLTLVPNQVDHTYISTSMSIGSNLSFFKLNLSPVRIKRTHFISANIVLHGKERNDPFNINSAGKWNASISVNNIELGIKLLKPDKFVILKIKNRIFGSISSRNGFSNVSISLKIKSGTNVIAFPGNLVLKKRLLENQGSLSLDLDTKGNFSIESKITPFQFGLFKISGVNKTHLHTTLSNSGFSLKSSAELRIIGLTITPYRINKLDIGSNGILEVYIEGGLLGIKGFFEISGGSFRLKRNSMDTSLYITTSKLTLFPNTNISKTFSTSNCFVNSNGNFSISSNDSIIIGIEKIFMVKGKFSLKRTNNQIVGKIQNAKIQALPNPLYRLNIGKEWLINLVDINIYISNKNFEQDITEHGDIIDLPLLKIFSRGDCKVFFGLRNGAYYIRFEKLRISIIDIRQVGTVSGKVGLNGIFKVAWDTPKDIKLGIFELPERKIKLSTAFNLKNQKFEVIVPKGQLIVKGVLGFSSRDNIQIQQISIGIGNNFIGLIDKFNFNGWDFLLLKTIRNNKNNFIKFDAETKSIIVRNIIDFNFGPNSTIYVKISSNGRIKGYITGHFKIGDIDLGQICLEYKNDKFIYISKLMDIEKKDIAKIEKFIGSFGTIAQYLVDSLIDFIVTTVSCQITIIISKAGVNFSIEAGGHTSDRVNIPVLSGGLDATIVRTKDKAYFFKNNEYYRFDFRKHRFDKKAKIGVNGWVGVPLSIDAVLIHPNNGKAYFFKKDKYYRYSFQLSIVDKVGIISIDGWRNVPSNINALLIHPTNKKAYFFKKDKYYRYSFQSSTVDKVGIISIDGWKGIPLDIDATLIHPISKKAYFFKDYKYYRYNFQLDKIDKIGIIGIDGWKS